MKLINYFILVFAFALLVLLSFVPGFIELRRPKDSGPIELDLERDIDERYFSRAFGQFLEEGLADAADVRLSTNGGVIIADDGLEEIVIDIHRGPEAAKISRGDLHLKEGSAVKEVMVVKGVLTTENRCSFEREIKVEKDCKTSSKNNLTAISAANISLGSFNTVTGWVDAEDSLNIEGGCQIMSRATAGKRVNVNGDGSFKSLAAPDIFIGFNGSDANEKKISLSDIPWSLELDKIVLDNFKKRPVTSIGSEIERLTNLKVGYTPILERAFRLKLIDDLTELKKEQKDYYLKGHQVWLQCGDTVRVKGNLDIPGGERIAGNLIVDGDLISGPNVVFEGGVHVKGTATVGDGNIINNSIIGGDDLTIGKGSVINECVVSTGFINIKEGVLIGKDRLGGVAGRRSVNVEGAVTIHGKIYGEDGIRITAKI